MKPILESAELFQVIYGVRILFSASITLDNYHLENYIVLSVGVELEDFIQPPAHSVVAYIQRKITLLVLFVFVQVLSPHME